MPIHAALQQNSAESFSSTDWITWQELAAEHFARTDGIVDRPVADLYVVDGRMRIGTLERDGRDSIAAYFLERRAQTDQTGRRTRHVISNFVVEQAAPQQARARFLCLVFVGVGKVPLMTAPPATIADFTADYVRSDYGSWMFQELHAAIIFTGPGAAPFAR